MIAIIPVFTDPVIFFRAFSIYFAALISTAHADLCSIPVSAQVTTAEHDVTITGAEESLVTDEKVLGGDLHQDQHTWNGSSISRTNVVIDAGRDMQTSRALMSLRQVSVPSMTNHQIPEITPQGRAERLIRRILRST